MSRDLIRNHLQKGLSQDQVKELIGPTYRVYKPCEAWQVLGAEAHVYEIESFGHTGLTTYACESITMRVGK